MFDEEISCGRKYDLSLEECKSSWLFLYRLASGLKLSLFEDVKIF